MKGYNWFYKSIKQMRLTVCQVNVHNHLSAKDITFRSTGVTVHISSVFHPKVITCSASCSMISQITFIFQPHVCLIVLNAHFFTINSQMESSVIVLLSSCTITTIFFLYATPMSFFWKHAILFYSSYKFIFIGYS